MNRITKEILTGAGKCFVGGLLFIGVTVIVLSVLAIFGIVEATL